MKVVQLGPFPPPHGGVATNVVAIHRALLERGLDAHVVNITGSRRPSTERVHYPASAVDLVRMLLRLRPDIVHLHIGGQVSSRLMALCFVCTMLPGARRVLTLHSGGYAQAASGRRPRRLSIAGLVFRRFDRIVVVNEQMQRVFESLGVPTKNVRLIVPYTPTGSSNGNGALPAPLEDFSASHEPLLVTVGALEPEYDLEFQLRLLREIAKRWPKIGLLVIGDGSQREWARQWLARDGVADRVILCGDMPHETTLQAITRAAALLRTTKYDGDSIAVREAIAAGTPVVATDNGMRPPGTELYQIGDGTGFVAALERALQAGRLPVARTSASSATSGADAVIDLYRELSA
jgi:glycosyltransferase involved in cell wall biosynthesis